MVETTIEARINERLFPKNVLTRRLAVPFSEYLATVFNCDLDTARLAEDIIRNLVPLCEIKQASEYELNSVTLPNDNLLVRNVIVKNDGNSVIFGYNRGSSPLIYLFGQPKLADTIPKVWAECIGSNEFRQYDHVIQEAIIKIAPRRDFDVVLRLNRLEYDENDIETVLEQEALAGYESVELESAPVEVKATSKRYWTTSARAYRNGETVVFVGKSQRQIQKGEPRNTIIDIFQDGRLALRIDINPIDPHSPLPNNYRMGVNRPVLDFASKADLVINETGEVKAIVPPYLLQYFSERRPFTQAVLHEHFTHALTGLLKEIETVIFYAGNFSPDVDIFRLIKFWTDNPRSDYSNFYLWSLIIGYGRSQDERSKVAEEEKEALLQRRSEITASYLRSMTRNPFLFLAIASSLHLMTHLSVGPEHSVNYFIREIIYMAQQVAPEINWSEAILSLDDLWRVLSTLTQYYEDRVLKNPQAKLQDTGAFLFADALNRNPKSRIARDVQLTPDGIVALFSPFDEEGEPRHLFFPSAD